MARWKRAHEMRGADTVGQHDLLHRRTALGRLCRSMMAAALAVTSLSSSTPACDTPVFRFAMYSPEWAPWPYTVYHLRDGEAMEEVRRVNQRLEAAARDEGGVPNVQLKSINTADDAALEGLPPAVRKLCQAPAAKRPLYAIVNPRRELVYASGLAEADVATLLESPARKRLGQLMTQGNVVFLLLEGKDAETNRTAESTVQEVIRLVGEGKLDDLLRPATPPLGSDAGPRKRADAAKSAAKSTAHEPPSSVTPKLALLKVSRRDAQEAWLVRMLMRADADLDEVADQPMVFPVYGRARVLPPCIGKGITKENLLDRTTGLAFLAGPCSCEAKDGNPGTDLLTKIDWLSVAASMARVYGDEESAEQLGDVTSLVPRLEGGSQRAGLTTQRSSVQTSKGSADGLVDLDPPSDLQATAIVPAAPPEAMTTDLESQSPSAARSLRMVGILVACMAVAAIFATLLFFLPRGRSGG